MSKAKPIAYLLGLSTSLYACLYFFEPETKVIYKDKIVEKIVLEENQDKIADAENKMQKMINFIDNAEKRTFAHIALKYFNLDIAVEDLDVAFNNAKALSVIMYQECGVCDKMERIFIGFSAYYNAVNYYNSDLVVTKNSQESSRACKYTYSFMCTPAKRDFVPEENLIEYMTDAVNIIYAPNDDFKKLREYYIQKNGQHKVHFCNTSVQNGDCTWHKAALQKAGGQPYKLIVGQNQDPYAVNLVDLGLHTFYPIIKEQKGE
jgi:hypothetical protein